MGKKCPAMSSGYSITKEHVHFQVDWSCLVFTAKPGGNAEPGAAGLVASLTLTVTNFTHSY